MPWWQTRLYEEGLVEEFARRDDEPGGRDERDRVVEVVPPEQVGIRWA